jgi:hypothetical protein
MVFRRLDPNQEATREPASEKRFRRIEPSTEPEHKQSRIESILSAGGKGLIKGAESLAAMRDPLGGIIENLFGKGPTSAQRTESILNQVLPSQEGFAESAAERTGKILPSLALGGGGLARSAGGALLGGLAGQAAEESGIGPIGQAIAEILGSGAAGLGKKAILPTKSQKPLVDLARKYGLSEEQIAPAIQAEKKVSRLSPIAHKGRSTTERLLKSRESIGKIYERMAESPQAQVPMSSQDTIGFLGDLHKEVMRLPSQVRQHFMKDFLELAQGGFNGKNLMNFYQDVNHYMGRGMKELGGLNKVVGSQLEKILGEDFRLTNQLYKNNIKLGIRIRPDLAEQFNNLRSGSELAYGIASGDAGLIKTALGEVLGRRLISGLLTKPRWQNLSKKMVEEIKNGRYAAAQKVLNLLQSELEKVEED